MAPLLSYSPIQHLAGCIDLFSDPSGCAFPYSPLWRSPSLPLSNLNKTLFPIQWSSPGPRCSLLLLHPCKLKLQLSHWFLGNTAGLGPFLPSGLLLNQALIVCSLISREMKAERSCIDVTTEHALRLTLFHRAFPDSPHPTHLTATGNLSFPQLLLH